MKVAVVAPSPVPFRLGGAERLVKGLADAINESTPHDAELVKLPSREFTLPDLVSTYRAFAELDLSHFDMVVSTKYPSWMIEHPRHVVYMLHPLRGLYDQYPSEWTDEPDRQERSVARMLDELAASNRGRHAHHAIFARWRECLEELGPGHPALAFPGPLSRAIVQRLDALALSPERTVGHFAISRTVAERSGYFPAGVRAQVLIPPSDLRGLRSGEHRGFFTASRLEDPKRLDLVVRAMSYVSADVPLTIAGTGPATESLRRLAVGDPRISFLGHISDERLLDEYADALAVPFVPVDEDLGYITIEAMRAAKPVITCTDSGGPTELVRDGENGFVVEPNAEALGAVMNRLANDPVLAAEMGERARAGTETITWGAVLDELLRAGEVAQPDHPSNAGVIGQVRRARPRVMVLATYPAAPQRHGGQIRCFHLCAALADRCDVTYICLDSAGGTPGVTQPHPGVTQIVVPSTPAFHDADGAYARPVGVPVSDITTALRWTSVPALAMTIQREARSADLAILAQPYLLPALQAVAPHLPFVYDSQNAEYAMKARMFGTTSTGAELARVVEEVERRAVRGAELVVTCSARDRSDLERLGPTLADWSLVPNGGDVSELPFVSGDERVANRRAWLDRLSALTGRHFDHIALFVASYHPPNLEAAETVVHVAADVPEVLFVLAGGHGSHFTHWQLPENVLVRGFVPKVELRRLLSIASVALNPMGSGGGSNLKLIEYFAAGVPVLSSEFGARGFPVRDGEHLRIVENDDLAAAIRDVLAEPDAARRAVAARHFAESECEWEIVGHRFRESVQAVIDRLGVLHHDAST